MRHKDAEEEEEDRELVGSGIAGSSVQYTKWEVDMSSDGFLHLQTRSKS